MPRSSGLRNYIKEETLAIHRDRGTNGNEIGENITIIKRKPRYGLYITGASYHVQMDGTKAVGIDGVTKEEYGRNLEENLEALIESLKKKSYKPKPARLVEIPKDNGKMRPLSIYCYEDKLVQEALRRILEAVFEPMFYDEMMGFRPNRGCHKAIRKLNIMLERKPTNYVLDADIKGFFQHLDHEWIVRFIESRIKDPNIIRLVRRMLKAGIMNNYEFEATEEGSGQGSVCSPIISCIYMHYVLIWWFREVVTPMLKGYAGLVVYADDCAPRRRKLVT